MLRFVMLLVEVLGIVGCLAGRAGEEGGLRCAHAVWNIYGTISYNTL